MNANKTPLQVVNEEHGGKAKLVDKIMGLIEARDGGEDKDSLKARLLAASNKKLLRLVKATEAVKEKYGSREKLVSAVADALGKAKDTDFVKRLAAFTNGRLLDMANLLHRKGKQVAPGHVAPKAEKKAKPAKAEAAAKGTKKPAAKKPAAEKAAKKPAAKKPAAKK
jgi:hypothetical protein